MAKSRQPSAFFDVGQKSLQELRSEFNTGAIFRRGPITSARLIAAWRWLRKLRRALVRPGRDQLSGVVEADEILIGGERSGKRGRGAGGKTLVVIAAQEGEKGIGRIRLCKVANAAGESLEPAVQSMIEPGTEVHTDAWRGYNGLSALGYKHTVIRATPDLGDNLLPLANRIASLLKRWLLGTHQGAAQSSHLDYYLDEHTFRFTRRRSKSRGLLFYRLVSQASHMNPIVASDLSKTPSIVENQQE